MKRSDVYFTNMRTGFQNNLLDKLRQLIKRAGMDKIDFDGKYVAIKMHFGEPGNLAFLRPNWAKVVGDEVKKCGGKPFLTDSNTLYVGGRKNALDHLSAAEENGFSTVSTGMHVIIADGLKGTDEAVVKIDGNSVKEAKIGRAIADSDIIISLSHFKGHESTGFGGALKNIGMGSGSRAGKMEMHAFGKPVADEEKCIGCRKCAKVCAHSAPVFNEKGKCRIDHEKCVGCGRCIGVCPKDAIREGESNSHEELQRRMMEYAKAVLLEKENFHISIAIDISPNCDCHSENDLAIVPNIGIFASFDPVAIDQAAADMVNKAYANAGSMLAESTEHTSDHFHDIHPDTNWEEGLEYAEEIGLGSRNYNLVVVE